MIGVQELNNEQALAVERMVLFLESKEPFFVLSGAAGTGKTFTIKELCKQVKGRLIFTAPTNKATKVLAETFSSDDLSGGYNPECRTIFSLLALRLEANGAVKELTRPEDPVDLTKYAAVIVDEASMINSNLWEYIKRTAKAQMVKFIFMGDAAQLPPVGEMNSPVWEIRKTTNLTKVMRHDNQILGLATRIRCLVNHPAPSIKIESNKGKGEGVWRVDGEDFKRRILADAEKGVFSQKTACKAIAWRNVTVDALNKTIRSAIFPGAFTGTGDFFPEDRIIMMEPAKDVVKGGIVATTDMEGTIERSSTDYHPTYEELKCYKIIAVMDDGHPVTLWRLHPEASAGYAIKLDRLAQNAKANNRLWKAYWNFKEAFHQLRYAYAITAHRAQGSTYDKVFVDMGDILQNRNRQEAFRCLYVSCTRPRKQLIIK